MKSIIYVGMDVHSTNYTLSCYSLENDTNFATVQVEPDYKNILKYLEKVQQNYGQPCEFLCGYEAGCLGFTLYISEILDVYVDVLLTFSPGYFYVNALLFWDRNQLLRLLCHENPSFVYANYSIYKGINATSISRIWNSLWNGIFRQ